MSAWTPSNEQRDKERFWRTKPKDPTAAFRKSGVPYYRPGKQRVLMPDDFMPLGPHAGKHMRAVPTDYLLWVNTQPWSKTWPHWQPVADYLERFPIEGATARVEADPLFYVTINPRLYTLPGHEDLLQTFAEAVLNQQPSHYEIGAPPHYQLTTRQALIALQHYPLVRTVTYRQTDEHRDLWIQYFQSRPKLPL